MGEDDFRAAFGGGIGVRGVFGKGIWLLVAIPQLLRGQPPAITQEGVRNLASQMPPALPGGALSPGALISVRGLRFSAPNQKTRILFRHESFETEAEAIRLGPEYIETRVPPKIAPGDAQLLVIRDDQASRPFSVHIRPGAFGIFAVNGKGWGPGGGEAHPGGAGAVSGTGLSGFRSAEVWVGGKQASHVAVMPVHGTPGTEEVRFELARDTPLGCFVPVVVKTDVSVSNVVTIPVAATGQPCPDSSMLGNSPDALLLLARLMMRVRLVGGTPADFTQDIGAAVFPGSADSPLFTGWRQLPPVRTCTAYSGNWISDSSSGGIVDFLFRSAGAGRDAGPAITVSGPKGAAPLQPRKDTPGFYTSELGGGLPFTRFPKPRFLTQGQFRISGGGDQVGDFAVEGRFPAPVKWRNPEKLDIIDRAAGALVRWSGASSKQRVLLLAINVDQLSGGMGACLCVAPGAEGRMQIPPMMLANVPASQALPGIPMNYLFIGLLPAQPQRFQARGVERGVAVLTSLQGRTVTFQ